jgi:DNA-directed RNA polymerase-3 subunit RPC5
MDIEDEDPVVAEYDVYITPEMAEQQLYVLQYLNRPPDQPFTKATESQPSELRIKKESGFIEVDVPINIHRNYNRVAGVRWGEAMRKTKGFGQKAFGIASGFERTMPRSTNRPGAAGEGGGPAAPIATEDDDNFDEYVTHFEDANEKGHVFNMQTFGGQIMHDDGKGPSYMLGTFRDSKWRTAAGIATRLTQCRRTPPHTLQRSRPTSNTVSPHRRLRPARSSPAPPREGVTGRCQGR